MNKLFSTYSFNQQQQSYLYRAPIHHNQYWSSSYYVSGAVLDTGDSAVNKRSRVPALEELLF